MQPGQQKRISDIASKLDIEGNISYEHEAILNERLVLAFSSFPRRTKKIDRIHVSAVERSMRKKASIIYKEVLRCAPHQLIPVILAISPWACKRFNVREYLAQERRAFSALNRSIQNVLDYVARIHGFDQEAASHQWINTLFPQGANSQGTSMKRANKMQQIKGSRDR
ncbi:hypothetical protein BU24DRAFT_32591 [Aaosphaeria arxii CBS 175.79]|uniref:Uncharacterized protein n=1 Tax=Aaosphaeria arxii CBS 175.79 TaxID=1450172 RepID=A0A6A5Y924_9PLEO|nr:uncharacterized protein BU24DRAFT_32591 [Aaosphaeria arxii CBS 175.79]KAF2021918.1 hypothetical protein BU24DRAFT_32591 [Aaosphaeria arxii CBS 175.79]